MSANLELTKEILRLTGADESRIRFVADRPGHDLRYSLNCEKLKSLGWQPEYDWKRGLKETTEWYLNHEDYWKPLKAKLDKRYITGFWNEKK